MGLFSFRRKPKVVAEVLGNVIVVTLPGSNFVIRYEKSKGASGLVATSFGGRKGQGAKVALPVFLAQAWKVANEKARELDWFV